MSFPKNDRKIQSHSGNSFQNEATGTEFNQQIAAALRSEFGGGPPSVKSVARLTGANERAVRNWFEAKNGPSGENLVILITHSDAILRTVLSISHRSHLLACMGVLELREKLADLLENIDDLDEAKK